MRYIKEAEEIKRIIYNIIETNGGIFRLKPTWIARGGSSTPGRRIKLKNIDVSQKLSVNERWFASTTYANNGEEFNKICPPDHGYSYIITDEGLIKFWLFDGLLFATSSFNWLYLLTLASVCLPIMFTLLLTLLPKRKLLLKNILKRDGGSIGAFVPAVFLALLLLHNLSNWLNSIKYFDMGDAGGMILCLFSFIFICCMVVTDLSIVIIVAIATTKERKKKSR